MKNLLDELDVHSRYCLRVNDYILMVELNICLPDVTELVKGKIWSCEDIFSFSIRFYRILEDE
ncbi:MAG: hypothetical protein AAGJ08_01770 [Cyanobacteria bacterium P01_H01_bin.35]